MTKKSLSVFAIGLLMWTGAMAQITTTTPPPTGAGTAAFEGHAGFIKSVEGKVTVVSAAGVTRPVKAGDPLAPEDRVETGKDSGASVVLRDGTMMVVGPASQLDLKAFRFDSTTQDGSIFVALLRGSMRMITGLIGKKDPAAVRVETQTATIGIRGTDFIVRADGKE